MSKLPDDINIAYDVVQDVLGAAISRCVSILNAEEAKEQPDQSIIDQYENELKKIFSVKRELSTNNRKRMQEIQDEYLQFVRDHRS